VQLDHFYLQERSLKEAKKWACYLVVVVITFPWLKVQFEHVEEAQWASMKLGKVILLCFVQLEPLEWPQFLSINLLKGSNVFLPSFIG